MVGQVNVDLYRSSALLLPFVDLGQCTYYLCKKQAQRIAIAEACGWKRQDGEEPIYGGKYIQSGWFDPSGKFHDGYIREKECGLPDYINDLNAMHEAEKVLNGVQQDQFCNLLGWPANDMPHAAWKVARATAAQRAEAFLRTIGKWKDSPHP